MINHFLNFMRKLLFIYKKVLPTTHNSTCSCYCKSLNDSGNVPLLRLCRKWEKLKFCLQYGVITILVWCWENLGWDIFTTADFTLSDLFISALFSENAHSLWHFLCSRLYHHCALLCTLVVYMFSPHRWVVSDFCLQKRAISGHKLQSMTAAALKQHEIHPLVWFIMNL